MNDLYCWETKFKSCCYSERLLTKLLLLNETAEQEIDILEVKKAIYYAKKYHGDQKRQSGEPYYSHPIEVAYLIVEYAVHYVTTDILVISILHDVIEDTALTKEVISYIFGDSIANKVEDLTRVKSDRKISVAEIVILLWLQRKVDLLLIKIFDRLHNMQTINAKPPEKINRITQETLKTFTSVGMFLQNIMPEILAVEETLMSLCLQNLPINELPVAQEPLAIFEDNFQLPSLIFQNEGSLC